jgi:hypothetical protein
MSYQKDMVPQKKVKDQECKTIKNEIAGNTVTRVMQCKDKNGVKDNTGKITYKGNNFAGTVHTLMTAAKGSKAESTPEMSGKRTGDCK